MLEIDACYACGAILIFPGTAHTVAADGVGVGSYISFLKIAPQRVVRASLAGVSCNWRIVCHQ